ncbi:acyltransferase family protein [Corynebacterium kozikiae]|uniref:acyltransferase family protein n=1 Tax=Corynebacterium kozikiae TaxID=2968469 RepID=UPI00211CE15B|nr:acyltransferase family protein [Corynebacterium sp. 76QC2CO]MCQ9343482.1 acyltransferase family protein [Corynebacterium sp. 76QC2CO]
MQHSPTQRLAWPDVAKGISILGVILLHATISVPGDEETLFTLINDFLYPLRMPLFFMVSGIFSVKVLQMTFAELYCRRLWFLIVPYVVWAPIEMFTYRYELHLALETRMPEAKHYLTKMFYATNMYWFLWLLVVFTVVLWATKFIPERFRPIALLVVLALSTVAVQGETSWRIFEYLPCFLFGAYFRVLLLEVGKRATSWQMLSLAALAALVGWTLRGVVTPDALLTARDALSSMLLIVPMVVASVYLAVLPGIGWLLQWVGRNTLALYISHALTITFLFKMPFGLELFKGTLPPSLMELPTEAWIGYIVLACLAVGWVTTWVMKLPVIGWTFHPPALLPQKQPTQAALKRQAVRAS